MVEAIDTMVLVGVSTSNSGNTIDVRTELTKCLTRIVTENKTLASSDSAGAVRSDSRSNSVRESPRTGYLVASKGNTLESSVALGSLLYVTGTDVGAEDVSIEENTDGASEASKVPLRNN